MGAAIAARLRETDEDVIVWNRSPEKAQASGLSVAKTPRELAAQSDVIVSILFDAAAVQAVYSTVPTDCSQQLRISSSSR